MTPIAIAHARGFLGEQLCKLALSQGHRVYGLVFGSVENPFNLTGVRYISLDDGPHKCPEDLATSDLKEVEILIHAGGPYTLDISLLDTKPGGPCALQESVPVDFPLQLECFYSHITEVILGLALQLPNLKHLIGLSSLAVGAKFSAQSMSKLGLKNKAKATTPKNDPTILLEAPIRSDHYPDFKSLEYKPMTHPLGLAALAFERSFEGSHGWKSASVQKTIVRLGTLIGDSTTGSYPNLKGLYSVVPFCHQLARGGSFINKLPFLPLPFHERSRLCLLPVDLAAKALLNLAFRAPSSSSKTEYRHLSDPDRDVSVRRFFAINMRHSGLDIPPLAVGATPLFEPIFQKLGLDTNLLKLMSFDVTCSAAQFKADVPRFALKPILEYYPTLLAYAQKHLLHKKPLGGATL
jgi:nucleoside-diphosphate-sugar epimerase